MTGFGPAVDAALDALVVPGFSRAGLAARSRLLPGFTVGDYPRLDGRTVIITGATSGIGLAAAMALARQGAAVHFLARDQGRADRARRAIAAASGSPQVSYGLADLEDPGTVRAFARDFRATHGRLDVLIHNAGAIHSQFRTDAAGTELTVLGQVITPFLLTRLMMPALFAAAPSRVIAVSSGGMYTQRLDPATLQMPASSYRGVTAYAKAKRAQVALSGEWARRLAGSGVAFHAMHPGWVGTPGIAAALPGFHRLAAPLLLSPEQGADTIAWLATAPPGQLGSGRFWHDRRPRPEHLLPWTREKNPAAARELWDHLAALTAPADPVRNREAPTRWAGLAFGQQISPTASCSVPRRGNPKVPANTTNADSSGFSAEERAAMKQRAAELRAEGKKGAKQADGLQAVLDSIEKMAPEDRALAERVHVTVTAAAPELSPKTWYGMPAYVNEDGKVVVFFQDSGKFKYRYSTLGFQEAANLDDGDIWPVSYAIETWNPAVAKKVTELVRAAIS